MSSSGSSSVELMLKDAEKLVSRLKEHEKAADLLVGQADGLQRTIRAKTAYMKEITALNEIARHRPRSELVLEIQMENQQIRRLQAENRDLRMLIDEHQSALDVIMTKYREQTAIVTAAKRTGGNGNRRSAFAHARALQRKREKVNELTAVMRRATEVDDGADDKGRAVIERLERENLRLRELLMICDNVCDDGGGCGTEIVTASFAGDEMMASRAASVDDGVLPTKNGGDNEKTMTDD